MLWLERRLHSRFGPGSGQSRAGNMKVRIFPSRDLANAAAAASLADWIASSPTCRVMVAGGNTPLDLYAQIACQKRDLSHLNIFCLLYTSDAADEEDSVD